MKVLILARVTCILFISTSAMAAQQYLVVGSYGSAKAANNEIVRLQKMIGIMIQISRISNGNHRLVAINSSANKQKFEAQGIKPWIISLESSQVAAGSLGNTTVSRDITHYLVLDGYRRSSVAETFAADIGNKSAHNTSVVETSVKDRPYFRVVSGPHKSAAKAIRNEYQKLGVKDTFWITDAKPAKSKPSSAARVKKPAPAKVATRAPG